MNLGERVHPHAKTARTVLLDREPRTFIHVKDGKRFDITCINIIVQMTNFSIAAVTTADALTPNATL